MFRQIGLPGPGPTTLLFRRVNRLLGAGHAPRPRVGLLHTSALAREGRQRARTLDKEDDRRRAEARAQAAASDLPAVISLPPPLDQFDITVPLQLIRDGISTKNLNQLIKGWNNIRSAQAMDLVPDDDYAAMSEFLARSLNPPNKLKILSVYQRLPAVYDLLVSMAVEAGAREHMMGLIELSMQLVSCGLPHETTTLYDLYGSCVRLLRGISRHHLGAAERTKRLGARLGGDAHRLFLLIHIASLTLQKQFNSDSMVQLLQGTAPYDAKRFEIEMRYIAETLNPPDLQEFVREYRANVDKWMMAITCYHPTALVGLIKHRARTKSPHLAVLYHQVVALSTGPNRIMIAGSTFDHQFKLTDGSAIVLPMTVWRTFMIHFAQGGFQTKALLERLINVDLPQLYNNNIPDYLLASAMVALAEAAANNTVWWSKARKRVNDIWNRLTAAGAHLDPLIVSMRMDAMRRLKLRREAMAFYHESCKNPALRREEDIGATMDMMYISLCINVKDVKGALNTLSTRNIVPTLLERLAVVSLISAIVTARYFTYDERRQALTILLSRKHPSTEVSAPGWGRVAVFMLEGGEDIPSTIATLAEHQPSVNPSAFWAGVVDNILVNPAVPRRTIIDTTLYVLKLYILPDPGLADIKILWVFQGILRQLTRLDLSADELHDELLSLVALIPDHRPRVRQAFINTIVRAVLALDNGKGIPEAIYWWKHCSQSKTDYTVMVHGLLRHGQHAVAKEFAQQAPYNCNWNFWEVVEKEFGIQRPPKPVRVVSGAAQTVQEAIRELHADEDSAEQEMKNEADDDADAESEEGDDEHLVDI